jgi:hypothetical protein
MIQTPFYIDHKDMLEFPNHSEYDLYCLMNLTKNYVARKLPKCTPMYVHVNEDDRSYIYIKIKDANGRYIKTDKHQDKIESFFNMKMCILYDSSLSSKRVDLTRFEGYTVIEKREVIMRDIRDEDDYTMYIVNFQRTIDDLPVVKNREKIYVGNDVSIRYNISRVISDPLFCDGYFINDIDDFDVKDLQLARCLPRISVSETLMADSRLDRDFRIYDQFRSFSRVSADSNLTVNRKIVPFKFIGFDKQDIDATLCRDIVKFYLDKTVTILDDGTCMEIMEIYETCLLHFQSIYNRRQEARYLTCSPLILLLNFSNIMLYDNFFFYIDSADGLTIEYEADALNKIRIFENSGYFWYELSDSLDITADLIKELDVEVFGIFTAADKSYVIGKCKGGQEFIEDTIIRIKMGVITPTSKRLNVPGEVHTVYLGDDVQYEVRDQGRVLELKNEMSQDEWTSGKYLNNWAKNYFNKTGRLSVYYL